MDKVRDFIRILYQQRFWVLCVTGLITAIVSWMLSASALDKEYASEVSKIDQKFNIIGTINRKLFHPNPAVIEKDQEQKNILGENVNKVWQDLYERQRSTVLKWPEVLGPRFVADIDKLKFGNDISLVNRGTYLNYIEKTFDTLLEIAKAKKAIGGGGREA